MESKKISPLVTVFTRYRWTPLHFRWAPDPETTNLSLLNEDICPLNRVSWHRVTVCEVARVNFNPVLEERVAFVITIEEGTYVILLVLQLLISRLWETLRTHTLQIFGDPGLSVRSLVTMDKILSFFLRLIVIWQLLAKLGLSLLGSRTMIPKIGWKTVESGGTIRV